MALQPWGSYISGIIRFRLFMASSKPIVLFGYPSPDIVVNNVWLNGRLINTTNRNYGDVSVIGPIMDDATKFSGDPCYTLETQMINGPVNQGDDFNASFYISGAGNANNCRLRISIPKNIIENGRFIWTYPENESPGKQASLNNINFKLKKVAQNGTILDMDISHIFIKGQNTTFANIGSIGVLDNGTFYPPFNIEFKIAKDAPAGDHNIYITLLFKNQDQWQMEKQTIPIHVRYWYESKWLQIFVYAALILGALASITRMIEFFGANRFWKKFKSKLIGLIYDP
jgi:hypothetical protein